MANIYPQSKIKCKTKGFKGKRELAQQCFHSNEMIKNHQECYSFVVSLAHFCLTVSHCCNVRNSKNRNEWYTSQV